MPHAMPSPSFNKMSCYRLCDFAIGTSGFQFEQTFGLHLVWKYASREFTELNFQKISTLGNGVAVSGAHHPLPWRQPGSGHQRRCRVWGQLVIWVVIMRSFDILF